MKIWSTDMIYTADIVPLKSLCYNAAQMIRMPIHVEITCRTIHNKFAILYKSEILDYIN